MHEQVLGQPTVEAEPDARRALQAVDAEVLGAGGTRFASAAAVQAVDGDRQTFLDAAHTGADRVNPAGILVTHHEWWPPRRHALLELVHDMQVGVAQPSTTDLDDHLAGPGSGSGRSSSSGSDWNRLSCSARTGSSS